MYKIAIFVYYENGKLSRKALQALHVLTFIAVFHFGCNGLQTASQRHQVLALLFICTLLFNYSSSIYIHLYIIVLYTDFKHFKP